ncbi:putative membrane protein [Rhodococcus sp. MTM3W5.2]|nr:putative membrane protein [Rhodococcus sp. MTM3W5.2]
MTLLIRLAINAIAIWLASSWVTGIDIATSDGGRATTSW